MLYFDPLDTDEMASAVERLLVDEKLRARLRKAGLERAKQFSWEETARRTLASYELALASSRS